VFTPEDSGVLWEAAPGEAVTISGSALLHLRWEPYRDGIFKADVPPDLLADQIFVNGEPQHMARYPNYDPQQRIMNGYAADCISPSVSPAGLIPPVASSMRCTRISGRLPLSHHRQERGWNAAL